MRAIVGAAIVTVALGLLGPWNAWGQESASPETPAPEQQPSAESPWSFRLTTYVWFAGLDGDVGVRGLPPADVDVEFSEIFDAIDWFPPPTMFVAEVRYDRFAFLTDFIYMGLEADGTAPDPLPVTAETEMDAVVWTFAGSYRVIEDDPVTLDLLAGGRLWNMESELTITGPLQTRRGSGSETWVDPIVGVSGQVGLGGGFALQAEGDVGGFGAAADLDWQVVGTLQYQLNDTVTVGAGYRYLAVDFEDNGLVLDIAMHGPIIGGSIRF
jgi:hypothetical protein